MTNFTEQSVFTEGVRMIEPGDSVIGGVNAPINLPFQVLANRTLWLKTELAKAVQNIGTLQGISITAGAGLAGGGSLSASRSLALATPSTLSGNTNNWVGNGATGHTHELAKATATLAGVVQLSSATNSDSEDRAATPKAVKTAYDKAVESAGKGLPVGAVIGFPRAVTNQEGYLKADGSPFNQSTYPDLYRVLGGNKLPNLTRSDVGMTAYFAFDDIPDGWIKYDEIATRVTQAAYPELYRKLVAQYGSIAAVPKAEDRFIRNAGSLTVGTTQEPLVASHAHPIGILWADNDDIMLHRLPGGGNKTSMTAGSPFAVINGESHGGSNQFGNVVQRGNGIVTENNASVITTITDQKVLSTNGDNRPSALAMVLCIKAKDSLDDVVMWVRAYGTVSNAGALDASTLAAGLQNKSDKGHTHRAADISNLGEAVKQQLAAAMQHQASTNGYTKLPNGLIDQWGEVLMGWRGEGPVKVVFPIAFASECYNVQITVKSSGRSGAVGADLTIGAGEITATGFSAMLNTWAQGVAANDFQGFLWRAIGK